MASHLSVITSAAGISSSKGLSAPANADAPDVFAALLGTPATRPRSAEPAPHTAPTDAGSVAQPSAGFGEKGARDNEAADAVAGLVDAVIPFQDAVEAAPILAGIAATLADLQARLAAGERLDPETLKQLEAALDKLAAALDIDLDTMPSLDELTALVTDIQPDDTSLAARLTAAFGPVAETLFSTSGSADASAELSPLLKSIGEKLAALLSALNRGDMAQDQIAQLELDAKADTGLDAALARMLKPALAVDGDPALASPELKLTEPTLTGKAPSPADAAAEAPIRVSTSQSGDKSGNDPAGSDRKPTDHRAPAAAIDTQPDVQSGIQPTQAARVDMVTAPRVVQAGYQTSQQQLNLPQLAFEIVRQASDGNTRFQIRLDPAELGRIDVRLDIDKSGQVHARLTVEKAETLDLMQRDQRGLERALQQAGLDGGKTNLEFALKQNPFGSGQHGHDDSNGRNPLFGDNASGEAEDTPPPTINLYRGSLSASGINIIA